jgi:hypothetical protein
MMLCHPTALLQAEALVHEFTPQEIANLLWAYAKLGMKPPHMLLVALWESVGGSSSATASSGSSISSPTSSAFATPLSAAAAADGLGSSSSSGGVTARLSAFKPGELSMLLWALASLRLVPGKLWWEQFLQASYHKMTSQSAQVRFRLGFAASCDGLLAKTQVGELLSIFKVSVAA